MKPRKEHCELRLTTLRVDYTNMREMFFGEPPDFDKIMALLKHWESEFNQK
jgi:hypothetical protein